MQPDNTDWFWREIVRVNSTRGIRFITVLLVADAGLLGVDLFRIVRTGVNTGAYRYAFIAHMALLGILLVAVLLHMVLRPVSADHVRPLHAVLLYSLAAMLLLFCTVSTVVDQSLSGQITLYVVGCTAVAVALLMPLRISAPLYLVNHAAFVIGITLTQPIAQVRASHLANGTIVMMLALVITKVMFDAQRRVYQGMSIIQSQQAHLERLAVEDSLTGLYNRRYADSRLKEEDQRAKRYGRPFSVAMADIDHFKQINDSFSHQTGDEVLRRLARLMRAEIRSVDVVARYGGEEFVLLFPETTLTAAGAVCEKMRRAVDAQNWEDVAEGLHVTVSIGVAGSDEADKLNDVVRAADDRLYRAKRQGRNRVSVD